MKLLTILLLAVLVVLVFLVSCGDNSGHDDPDYVRPDTIVVPPTDTLGVDTLLTETMDRIKKRKGVDQTQEKSIVYYQRVKRTFKYHVD